jgi:acetyl esterase/lipase
MNASTQVNGGLTAVLSMVLMLGGIDANWVMAQTATPAPQPFLTPQPLQPGADVVPLWPPGSPELRPLAGYDQPEKGVTDPSRPDYIQSLTNVHNPSIEVHLAPPDKATGLAIVVSPGGGNTKLMVGLEGTDIAAWLNGLGISAFIERYRLRPYGSGTDALADTQRSIRLVRANAKEWNIDPKRVGIMGFSAGGEQAARVAMNYDAGDANSADPVARQGCRPDFVALIYAGWAKPFDLSHIPKDAPPAFCTVAGVDDYFHSSETMDFTNAWLNAKIPVELHVYAHGGHGNGIKPRNGIPFGTWPDRFVDWAKDSGLMKPTAANP